MQKLHWKTRRSDCAIVMVLSDVWPRSARIVNIIMTTTTNRNVIHSRRSEKLVVRTWWSFPSPSGLCRSVCHDSFWTEPPLRRTRRTLSRRRTRPDPFPWVSFPAPWARPRSSWSTGRTPMPSPSWFSSCTCLQKIVIQTTVSIWTSSDGDVIVINTVTGYNLRTDG